MNDEPERTAGLLVRHGVTSRDRLAGAAAALAVLVVLGWLLIAGLATTWRRVPDEALAVFRVSPPPAPLAPQIVRETRRSPRERRAPAPPNIRSAATELTAPIPVIPPPRPSPVAVALLASTGGQAQSGASLIAGPGTGSGGVGNGSGGGGSGRGDGSGDDTPPRWHSGRLHDSDYPLSAGEQGSTGTVGVRYLVGVGGRVAECDVAHSSGSKDLDETTCRLIRQRFRFKPSRDAEGRPVPAWVIEDHEWVIDHPPAASVR